MFELDYLTQRLTFTRSDVGHPKMSAGTRRRSPARSPRSRSRTRAARGRTRRVHPVIRDGGAVVTARTGLGGRHRERPAPGGGTVGRSISRRAAHRDLPADDASIPGRHRPEPPRRLDRDPGQPCLHSPPRGAAVGRRARDRDGRVVGAGKMGLPLAAQFAGHGWQVTAVDVNEAVVTGDQRRPVARCRGARPGRQSPRPTRGSTAGDDERRGRRKAVDVVVLIVPVMLDDRHQPDYRYMDAAVAPSGRACSRQRRHLRDDAPGRRHAQAVRPAPRGGSGLIADRTCSSPFLPSDSCPGPCSRTSRLSEAGWRRRPGLDGAGRGVLRLGARCRGRGDDRAEAAEFSKLAETTYRDVNIALANEFANYAERAGVDILEVIAASNSQPYSHIHQPGIGVGGHCIPVYPHFLLSRAPELTLVAASRRANDGQVDRSIESIARRRRSRRPDGPRARADLPPRGEGAGVLARAAVDRGPAGTWSPGPRRRPAAHG